MAKYTEAQARASKKWDDKNKEKKRYIVAKSTAKRFITKMIEAEDLEDFEMYLQERKKSLKNS